MEHKFTTPTHVLSVFWGLDHGRLQNMGQRPAVLGGFIRPRVAGSQWEDSLDNFPKAPAKKETPQPHHIPRKTHVDNKKVS